MAEGIGKSEFEDGEFELPGQKFPMDSGAGNFPMDATPGKFPMTRRNFEGPAKKAERKKK